MPTARYIGMEHVEAHTNKILATVSASSMASSAAVFAAGNVLYGRMRPYLNKVVRPEFSGLASAEFIVFPQSLALDLDFLLMRLSASDFVRFACSQYEGDRPRVKFEQLGKFSLSLPPLAEQTRIVAKLEELLSDLDVGVAELKAAQAKLARYRQSLLKAAVSGELTAAWRRDHPATETGAELLTRILRERRTRWEQQQRERYAAQGKLLPKSRQHKYPEPVAPDITGLPELSQGWVWASIAQLSVAQRYGTSAKTSENDAGVPVLRMGNIQDGDLDLRNLKYLPVDHEEFPDLFLDDGDLLFNRTNSPELVGKTAVYRSQVSPCSYASYLIAVKLSDNYVPELASAYINSVYGRHWVKSVVVQQVGQANVNGTKLAALAIPLPPISEQREIMTALQAQLTTVQDQQSAITHALALSAAQRQNLLRAAFAGELVAQDPRDEPASALLARIRAERAAQGMARKPRGRKARGVA